MVAQTGTCVSYYDVHNDAWVRPEPPSVPDARAAWRQAVATVAARTRAALPECNGRVEAAVKLVLAGDVTLHADGTAQVASQSEPETVYTVNGTCECPDFPKAPHGGMCKHRIALGIARRAQELLRKEVQALDGQAEACEPVAISGLPEAPASANVYVDIAGRKVQVTLRDSDEDRLMTRMARLMARYPMGEVVQAPEAPAAPPEGFCAIYRVQMYWNEAQDGPGGWWSHRTAEGTWCKGRVRQNRRRQG